VGSGNGLARSLGLSRNPVAALRELSGAVTRLMDVGFANERPFLNVAGAGFDAVIGRAFQEKGGRRGLLSYIRLSLAHSYRYVPDELTLEVDEGRFVSRPLIIVAVNGRQYGAGAILAPKGRLDDGLLSVVAFEHASLPEIFWNVPRLFSGTLSRSRRFRSFETRQAVISAGRPFPHHSDGEPEAPSPRLVLRLEPRSLPVLVPSAVAFDPEGPFSQET
jgi:diacylglycerol kinase family enzyme